MYLIYDTETNGLDAPVHIMQLGAVLLGPDFRELETFDTLVALPDGVEVHPKAQAAHGLTAGAVSTGAPPQTALSRLRALAQNAQWAVAYNNTFDVSVIRDSAVRLGVEDPFGPLAHFCMMRAMTPVLQLRGFKPGKFKWPRLMEAHQFALREGFDMAHSAIEDVRATGRVLEWYVKNVGPLTKGAPGFIKPLNPGVIAHRMEPGTYGPN